MYIYPLTHLHTFVRIDFMEDKYIVNMEEISKKDGLHIFKMLVEFEKVKKEYEIHAFRKDILLKEEDLTEEKLRVFAITEMKDWIKRSGGLPKEKFLQLANGGKIPKDNIDEDKLIKKAIRILFNQGTTNIFLVLGLSKYKFK